MCTKPSQCSLISSEEYEIFLSDFVAQVEEILTSVKVRHFTSANVLKEGECILSFCEGFDKIS